MLFMNNYLVALPRHVQLLGMLYLYHVFTLE